ncbi:GTP-dependent nucleic acid-binding protein engD [Phytophthora cinnamomi]|uniref:GTP-dependent nucleic acid-binding protein engD n=1 Tax=Phytophthora cinnamomi TaxID=4785 RepID=UPI00355A33BE|nr:GTP-dependent nucleic acid-binding protein engD [Phytophthora cinnamomi]
MLAPARASRPTFSNRQVDEFYFRPCRDEYGEVVLEYYRCRCGSVRKRAHKTGFTNLLQHVRREYPAFEAEMLAAIPGETGSVTSYIRQSSQNLCDWLDWVVNGNLPLSFYESKLARRYTNLKPICVETLCSEMDGVTRAVERTIVAEMWDNFGLLIDGWSHESENYVAVFAYHEVGCVTWLPLLSMTPLIDEKTDNLSAASHRAFLDTMLARDYDRRLELCLFLVEDNCSVNHRMVMLTGVPLVGCASHRLNLVIHQLLQQFRKSWRHFKL